MAFVMFITSCDRQSCEDVVCSANNSTCFEGQCFCALGYEGDLCEEFTFQKYVGNYQVSQNCSTTLQGNQNSTYNSFITQGSDIDRVTITSFAGQYTVEAFFVIGTDGNEVFIDQTVFGNTTIVGSGRFIPGVNRLEIDFNIESGSNFQQCTAIYQKL